PFPRTAHGFDLSKNNFGGARVLRHDGQPARTPMNAMRVPAGYWRPEQRDSLTDMDMGLTVLGSADHNVASGFRMRRRDGDPDIGPESIEEAEKAVCREAVQSAIQEGRYFGLRDSEELAGGDLGEPAALNDPQNPCRQFRF